MTRKGSFNKIVRSADSLLKQLSALQNKADELVGTILEHCDEWDEEDLDELNSTLIDLVNFDLEDSIPEKI